MKNRIFSAKKSQISALPNGVNLYASAPIYDVRTSASYSGNIIVTETISNVADAQGCNNLRLLHFENGAWTTDGNATPSYNAGTMICTVSQTVTSLSPFAVVQLAPLAAGVSIGGRVMTKDGQGIANATVMLTDAGGETHTVRTSSFGYYSFDEIEVGQTVVISVMSRRFIFSQPSQVVSVSEFIGNLDFISHD